MGHSLIGTRLAHYEMIGALGSGAMSEVYLARDTQLDKDVAVKVISENLIQRTDLVDRFEREARAAARLEHPNLATIYYSSTHEGQRFYAMELVRGWSLSDLIEAHVSMTWDQLLSLFAQACVGFGAAQAAGVIHRDIKPGNLMIAQDGRLKIVDFGLARLGNDKTLSRAGAMMGTPFYIAPEMVQGRGGDHLSDIYSLGVTMAHAILGVPPYDAETPYGVMMQHVNEPVPVLHELNRCVPRPLSELLTVMMAKDPLSRPPSYHRVHLALRRIAAAIPRDELEASPLQWCGLDKMNSTAAEDGRCSVCGKPYGLRELPETYHVDLVNWNRTDARAEVAAYIAAAVGQSEDDVALLLDPLPFRAAFRVPRDRAKRMHVTFHDLGAIVELVPSDDDSAKELDIKELPIAPRWPRSGNESTGDPGESLGLRIHSKLKPIRPPASARPWQAATAALGLMVLVLVVMVLQKPSIVVVDRPVLPDSGGSAARGAAPPLDVIRTPLPTERTEGPAPVVVGSRGAGGQEETVAAAPSASVVRPVTSGWFDVTPTDLDNEMVRTVVGALDGAAVQIAETIPFAADPPMRLVLTSAPLEASEVVQGPPLQFPTGGVTRSGHPLLAEIARGAVASTVVRRLGGDGTPLWLLVGLSGYLAEGPLAEPDWPEAIVAAGLPTEIEITTGTNPRATRRLLRGFVTFVIQTRGEEAVQRTLELLQEGRTIDDAALRALGTTPSDLEQEWVGLAGGVD
jgi:tRNA A-37 threonylcarbamoyl transferase component Bud32